MRSSREKLYQNPNAFMESVHPEDLEEVPANSDDAAIVRAIIALSHGLNLEAVAEGVENEEQLDFLNRNGCDQIQGYYVSKPLPSQELEEMFRSFSIIKWADTSDYEI